VRRRRPPALALVAALALLMTLAVAGCGSTSLSAQQLHAGARRACRAAVRRMHTIPTPELPAAGAGFIKRGIAVFTPELAALERLRPGAELAKRYARAVTVTRAELTALRSTVIGLRAGNDPVVAIKTLQQQLLALEQRAASAWAGVGVPDCAGT